MRGLCGPDKAALFICNDGGGKECDVFWDNHFDVDYILKNITIMWLKHFLST